MRMPPALQIATAEVPLRDLFAAFALAGLLAHRGCASTPQEDARYAVTRADALLAALHPESGDRGGVR